EDAGAARVGDDPDPRPGRDRLRGEQRRDVEELLERAGADHAGLLEERIDGDVEARPRRRGTPGGPGAGGGPAGLHGDDRLAARDLGRDAGELARVPEALEVQDDDRGPRIIGPVAEQVVARDVGLVADGDEARDAEVERTDLVEDGDPQRAAL